METGRQVRNHVFFSWSSCFQHLHGSSKGTTDNHCSRLDNVACLFGCLLAWSSGPGTCCAVGPTPFCRKVLPWRWSQLDMAPGGQLLPDRPASSFFQPMCYHTLAQFTKSIFGTMKLCFTWMCVLKGGRCCMILIGRLTTCNSFCWQWQETFDHVVSYASIYHLEKDEQCHLVQQFDDGSAECNGY